MECLNQVKYIYLLKHLSFYSNEKFQDRSFSFSF